MDHTQTQQSSSRDLEPFFSSAFNIPVWFSLWTCLFAFLLSVSLCIETLILLMKFVFLVCDSSIVSFFSIFFQPGFIFEPLLIAISIQMSQGKHEYGFPVRDWASKPFAMCSSVALVSVLISVQNSTSHLP